MAVRSLRAGAPRSSVGRSLDGGDGDPMAGPTRGTTRRTTIDAAWPPMRSRGAQRPEPESQARRTSLHGRPTAGDSQALENFKTELMTMDNVTDLVQWSNLANVPGGWRTARLDFGICRAGCGGRSTPRSASGCGRDGQLWRDQRRPARRQRHRGDGRRRHADRRRVRSPVVTGLDLADGWSTPPSRTPAVASAAGRRPTLRRGRRRPRAHLRRLDPRSGWQVSRPGASCHCLLGAAGTLSVVRRRRTVPVHPSTSRAACTGEREGRGHLAMIGLLSAGSYRTRSGVHRRRSSSWAGPWSTSSCWA